MMNLLPRRRIITRKMKVSKNSDARSHLGNRRTISIVKFGFCSHPPCFARTKIYMLSVPGLTLVLPSTRSYQAVNQALRFLEDMKTTARTGFLDKVL